MVEFMIRATVIVLHETDCTSHRLWTQRPDFWVQKPKSITHL